MATRKRGYQLTLPGQEIKRSPQLATLLAPAPPLELQRTALTADAEFVGPKKGKPRLASLNGAEENVGALVRGAQKNNNGQFVVIQSPGTPLSAPQGEDGLEKGMAAWDSEHTV